MCRPLALKFPALSKRQSKKRNMQNRTTSWFSCSFIWCIWYRATDSAGTRRQDFIRFDFYGIIISQTGICRKPCFACKFTAKRLFCQTFFCFFCRFYRKNTTNSRIFAKDSAGEPERSCWRYPISRAAHPALLLHVSVLI